MSHKPDFEANFVCINCGNKAEKLYHEYHGGTIKITHCQKCDKVVDKYIEYDLVVVSLDALLLKRQAFRHILINKGIKAHWKFCLVLLLGEAFTKLLHQHSQDQTKQLLPDHVIYSALEINLYWNFFLAVLELFSFLFGVILCLYVWKSLGRGTSKWPSIRECSCGLMLSNFGRILILPAMLWGHTYTDLYIWLTHVFTLAANIQAARVLCPSWNVTVLALSVLFGHLLTYGIYWLVPSKLSFVT